LTETADAIYLPFGTMSGLGMFFWGMILDRFNVQQRVRYLAYSFLGLVATFFALFKVQGPLTAALWGGFYGFMFGMWNSFNAPMFADLFGMKNLGKVQGLNTFFILLALGVGPACFGVSFDLI